MSFLFGNNQNSQDNQDPEWKYDDLPTPEKDEDFKQLGEESIKQRLEWFKGTEKDGWRTFCDEDGILIEEKDIPGSNIPVIRATTVLKNVDIKKVDKLVFDSTTEEKQELADDIMFHEKIKEFDENCHLARSHYKTPMMISNREFLALRTRRVLNDNNSVLIAVQSLNYKDVPFSNGFVRGSSVCATLLESMDDNNVKAITLDHVDPKGSIPTMIVNAYKKKAAFRLQQIQRVYEGRFD